ncbi:MAG: DNA polymerase IV [Patescibacteria group bacterium]|jgi:DNA polymerase-4
MLPPPSRKLIAHVDMNSFFASVEQQANPFLRGEPIGVCAYLHNYGCIIASSIEAKRLGVKAGTTVEKARELCPRIKLVQNDPPKYRSVSSKVFSMLSELTDRMEVYSIDEAFLDLTDWYRDPAEAAWALIKIRRRITEEVGDWLRCSIGIAPTRFLAKTASDLEKPNGLVVLNQDNLDDVLGRLDLEDVCGIGPRIRKRLERAGMRTLMDVKRYPPANLMRLFGKYGLFLWCKLHGMEFERVSTQEELPPKSIGHSYCVPRRVNREKKVLPVLVRLTERAGRRMRREGMYAGKISVSVGFRTPTGPRPTGPFWNPIRDGDAGGFEYTHLDEPAQDSFTLVAEACRLLESMWSGQEVNFLAVTFSDLSVPNGQQRIPSIVQPKFDRLDDPKRERQRLVSNAVDFVRDRYGDESIVLGSMFRLGDEAPDRIGFRKTTGLDIIRAP